MLQPLANVVEPGADFFVEDLALTAIVFDAADDDVTLWLTALFDDELHFFHLAATFSDLSTLLRLAEGRGPAVEEELADVLSGSAPPSEHPFTDETGAPVHPTLLEFTSDERPPLMLPGVALKLAFTYIDEADTEVAFNIFTLEGIYLHIS